MTVAHKFLSDEDTAKTLSTSLFAQFNHKIEKFEIIEEMGSGFSIYEVPIASGDTEAPAWVEAKRIIWSVKKLSHFLKVMEFGSVKMTKSLLKTLSVSRIWKSESRRTMCSSTPSV